MLFRRFGSFSAVELNPELQQDTLTWIGEGNRIYRVCKAPYTRRASIRSALAISSLAPATCASLIDMLVEVDARATGHSRHP